MYKIVRKKELNSAVTLMEIEAPFIAKKAKAGQFIIFRVDEMSERVPLTIAGYDREKGTVTIIFQKVGFSTIALGNLNEGDYIRDFVGPLGKPTPVEGKKKVCVVGGGVGCAIALPSAAAFKEAGVKYPYSSSNSDYGAEHLWAQFASFGVPENTYYYFIDENNKVQFTCAQDGWRACVEWLHQLYEEELMDPESLTQDSNLWANKVNDGEVGYFCYLRLINTALSLKEVATEDVQEAVESMVILEKASPLCWANRYSTANSSTKMACWITASISR